MKTSAQRISDRSSYLPHPLHVQRITQDLLILAQINGTSWKENHRVNEHRVRDRSGDRPSGHSVFSPIRSKSPPHIPNDINPGANAQLFPGHRLQDSIDINGDGWWIQRWRWPFGAGVIVFEDQEASGDMVCFDTISQSTIEY